MNVWTYKYFNTAIRNEKEDIGNFTSLDGIYLQPPDLFVEEMTRECIERTVAHLLTRGNLEDVLNPSVGPNEPMTDEEIMEKCFFDPPITVPAGTDLTRVLKEAEGTGKVSKEGLKEVLKNQGIKFSEGEKDADV